MAASAEEITFEGSKTGFGSTMVHHAAIGSTEPSPLTMIWTLVIDDALAAAPAA